MKAYGDASMLATILPPWQSQRAYKRRHIYIIHTHVLTHIKNPMCFKVLIDKNAAHRASLCLLKTIKTSFLISKLHTKDKMMLKREQTHRHA